MRSTQTSRPVPVRPGRRLDAAPSPPGRAVPGNLLTTLLVIVAAPTAFLMVWDPDLLLGPAAMNDSARGTALVVLVLGVPVVVGGALAARGGRLLGLSAQTGGLAFLTYKGAPDRRRLPEDRERGSVPSTRPVTHQHLVAVPGDRWGDERRAQRAVHHRSCDGMRPRPEVPAVVRAADDHQVGAHRLLDDPVARVAVDQVRPDEHVGVVLTRTCHNRGEAPLHLAEVDRLAAPRHRVLAQPALPAAPRPRRRRTAPPRRPDPRRRARRTRVDVRRAYGSPERHDDHRAARVRYHRRPDTAREQLVGQVDVVVPRTSSDTSADTARRVATADAYLITRRTRVPVSSRKPANVLSTKVSALHTGPSSRSSARTPA